MNSMHGVEAIYILMRRILVLRLRLHIANRIICLRLGWHMPPACPACFTAPGQAQCQLTTSLDPAYSYINNNEREPLTLILSTIDSQLMASICPFLSAFLSTIIKLVNNSFLASSTNLYTIERTWDIANRICCYTTLSSIH